jgi:hypothetical protein
VSSRPVPRALGFDSSNRIDCRRVNVVGGKAWMDMHWLEYLRVGTAKAYRVMFGVCGHWL